MNRVAHAGSCLCGTVQYRIHGNLGQLFCCHCTRCQKGTGSIHGANIFAPGARLEWLAGEAKVRQYHVPGTRHARSFCTDCGSPMPSLQMNHTVVVIPAGSLDTAIEIEPTAHLWCAADAGWTSSLATAPRFEEMPPPEFFARPSKSVPPAE